ncbi:MAG: bifunctional diguanylate cyclase/phosphodiesterase, partial [Burkholderiaceae bacterium]
EGRWVVHAAVEAPDVRRELEALFGAARTFIAPVQWRGGLCGMVAVWGPNEPQISGDTSRQLSALADRVAVALAARAREEQLVSRALHDDLTALPNRRQLYEFLVHEVARAQREPTNLALLFVDLDRFKSVNDTFGHDGGDVLLRTVGERLRASVRDCDLVARVGGDEFVVVLSAIPLPTEAARVAANIVAALSAPVLIQEKECVIGASIGISLFPGDGASVDDLLRHADSAMYRAKSAGRGCVMFYEESMNVEERERAELQAELRQALARKQLEVHYQPRVEMSAGRFVSVEALLRWRHPQWGWVSPARFIPVAEDIGLIDAIGTWVLEQSCQQLAAWHAAGLAIERVSVNVSGRQLRTDALIAIVARTLAAARLPPTALELEVTESLLLDNVTEVIDTLSRIRDTGVTIALDDFGTGYSSLNYLRRLPIDVLKIDQSFVRDLETDVSARGIAQAIIAMAHALGKSVTAEGVETLAQADLLRAWGCREAQGYYFGRPMPPAALAALLPQQLPALASPEIRAEEATRVVEPGVS